MTISTISTSQQSFAMRSIIARQNAEHQTLIQEAASGKKSDIYAEGGGAGAEALAMRQRMEETQTYMTTNEVLEGRLDIMAETFSNISSLAGDFQNLTLTDSMPSQSPDTYQDQARYTMDSIVSALNITYGGAYLFSGLATDQAAIEVDGAGTGVNYLADTTGNLGAQIDGDTRLDYGIRADNPAFEKIFEGLGRVIAANFSTMTEADIDTLLNDVAVDINEGVTALTSIEARHGNNQKLLSNKIEENSSYLAIYNNTISGLETAEPEETALRLNEVTNQLEVSYQITSRMSGMSLLDYL